MQGDLIVFTTDAAGKSDGTLTVQLDTKPRAARITGAVTGGTGAYANARGVFVAIVGKTGATDTVMLRP
jgi:hypothetical protein